MSSSDQKQEIESFHRRLAEIHKLPETQTDAQQAWEKRKTESKSEPRVDNSALYAGLPMYFYCESCGGPAQRLMEGYAPSDRVSFCAACQEMINKGWAPLAQGVASN